MLFRSAEYGDKKGEQVYYAWKRKQAMREEADCGCEEEQRDKRGDYAKKELIKNQIRARLGIKNPLVMVASEQHRPPAGWKSSGGGPEDRPIKSQYGNRFAGDDIQGGWKERERNGGKSQVKPAD